jgi:hypothetical protein
VTSDEGGAGLARAAGCFRQIDDAPNLDDYENGPLFGVNIDCWDEIKPARF